MRLAGEPQCRSGLPEVPDGRSCCSCVKGNAKFGTRFG